MAICQFAIAYARNLSLDEATRLVLAESQDIKKTENNIRAAEVALESVWTPIQIDASATYANYENFANLNHLKPAITGMPQIDNVGAIGAKISAPLFTFGKIVLAGKMARRGLEIARTSQKLAKLEMEVAAAGLYWTAKLTDEFVKIAENSLKSTLSAQRQLTATGRANRSNLVKISADAASREIDLEDAKFNRDSAHRLLKAYAGIDDDEEIVLTTEFPEKFSGIARKEISPLEWDILERTARMNDEKKWQNRVGYLPTLSAFAGYDYATYGESAGDLMNEFSHNTSLGLSLNWTIFDGGIKRAAAVQAAMDAESARLDLDKSRKIKTAEYRDLVQKYGHLQKNLTDLHRASDLSDKAYKLSVDRFLAGQTSATELADVEQSTAGMKKQILNTKLQMLLTLENIKKYETEGTK